MVYIYMYVYIYISMYVLKRVVKAKKMINLQISSYLKIF